MTVNMIQIKKKRFILYLLLCFILGLFVSGIGIGFSFYHHFFESGEFSRDQRHSRHISRLFKHLDRDPRDGVISQQELQAFGKKTFFYLDDNEDGFLSSSELPARYLRGWGKELLIAFENKQALSREDFLKLLLEIFQQQDTNKDQQVSLQEMHEGFQRRLFKKLDKDGDGQLSLQEFSAHKPPARRHKR